MAGEIRLTVRAGAYDRVDCAVCADVSALNVDELSEISLFELKDGKRRAVASQLAPDGDGKTVLYWVLDGRTGAGESRTFAAETKRKRAAGACPMDVEDTQTALILKRNGRQVLQYVYDYLPPPEGAKEAFGRSGGFIHPVWSPEGNVLTNIQPADHLHHLGIWNPWTHVVYGEKDYDLWNIGSGTGTVRARDVEQICRGTVFAGYTALLDHCIFNSEGEQVIMNEYWKVKTWNAGEGFLWDFESHLHPSTALPVLLKKHRYAGFGYRATPEWTAENCEMVSSEGKTRQEINGTNGRWIYITGETATGRSGLLFLGHPANRNAPEPLYVWDKTANGGRGDAFINFVTVRDDDWELQPGGHYILRYRVMAYEGEMTPERAERLWNDFARPPEVTVE
jgi:hypothetical protein